MINTGIHFSWKNTMNDSNNQNNNRPRDPQGPSNNRPQRQHQPQRHHSQQRHPQQRQPQGNNAQGNGQNNNNSSNPSSPHNNQRNASANGGQPNSNNRRRNNRRNRYPKRGASAHVPKGPVPLSEKRPPHLDRAYEKYQNLLDQHLIARRKYFELYYRADHLQKNKLERNFYQTLYDLRDFEDKCTDEIRDYLLIKTNGKREDLIYSENHLLPKTGVLEVEGNQFEDPHYLPSQARADFTEDTEESSGSYEDYKNYKGL